MGTTLAVLCAVGVICVAMGASGDDLATDRRWYVAAGLFFGAACAIAAYHGAHL